jgi:hypothetical protein
MDNNSCMKNLMCFVMWAAGGCMVTGCMVTRGGAVIAARFGQQRNSREQHVDQHAGKARFGNLWGLMEFISFYLAGKVPI